MSLFSLRFILLTLFISTPVQAITLLNWPDYMDAQLLEEFKQKTGIEVTEVFFDSEVELDRIVANHAIPIDVMVISNAALRNYIALKWVDPIPHNLKSNLPDILAAPQAIQANAKLDYGIPYFWGTLGIAYRKDKVDKPLQSWSDLFIPGPTLSGKVALLDAPRDIFAMAQKMLGYSANTHNKKEVAEAAEILKVNAHKYHSFEYTALDEQSLLLSDEVYAAAMFNGDALVLKEMNNNIEFVLPKEGGNLWVDLFAVHSNSQHKAEAWKFIQFITAPEQSVRLAQTLQFAPPNLETKHLLPPEIVSNKAIYPDTKALSKSEVYQSLPAELVRHINLEFNQVKQAQKTKRYP